MTPQDLERRARRERLREILEPTPVELGKFPRWFPWKRENKLPGFFDHWGRTMTGRGYVLVAEPNFTTMFEEQWEEVRQFAIKYDLRYLIVPNSYHEPGNTLRVVFWNEDWLDPCSDAR